jgi:long-subunit fatty acid transport protein
MKLARKLNVLALASLSGAAFSQVPDLVTAIDAGGRAMGAGSALNLTGVSTLSATYNPAALAYIRRKELGVAIRTLPSTDSIVTGSVSDPQYLSSDTEAGDFRLSHVGLAMPMGPNGRRGVVGIAYTIGGWFHDTQRGGNMSGGVATFEDFTRARTDFFNVSYGRTGGDQSFAWGVGLVVAQQNVRNFRRITFSDTQIPPVVADSDLTGYGVGVQAGVMLTPRNRPDVTLAFSARSPIEIDNDSNGVYDRIPGRLAAGIATRRDGFRGGRDFLILGAEAQYFFDGEDSPRIDRNNHGTAHFGAEYNYDLGSATLPIRLGYSLVPKGGDDFRSRNSFTYGFGYRPKDGDWSIEVNFGRPSGGGQETGVFFSSRFGN